MTFYNARGTTNLCGTLSPLVGLLETTSRENEKHLSGTLILRMPSAIVEYSVHEGKISVLGETAHLVMLLRADGVIEQYVMVDKKDRPEEVAGVYKGVGLFLPEGIASLQQAADYMMGTREPTPPKQVVLELSERTEGVRLSSTVVQSSVQEHERAFPDGNPAMRERFC